MTVFRFSDGSQINCDDNSRLVFDAKGNEETKADDDTELAKIIADAVTTALRAHREAGDSRDPADEEDLTDQEKADCYDKAKDRKAKDNLPDPDDHRKDFNTISGNGAKDAALAMDYRTRVIRSEFGFLGQRMSDGRPDLDSMFRVPVHRDDESLIAHDSVAKHTDLADLDALFGGRRAS